MTKSQQTPRPWQVPEKMPQTLQDLDRAIMLLGSMLKAQLRFKARQELTELLGCLPTPQMAPVWKLALKRRRKSFIEQVEDNKPTPTNQSEVSP